MTELSFLSPDRARREDLFQPRFASPLARVLAGTPVAPNAVTLFTLALAAGVTAALCLG